MKIRRWAVPWFVIPVVLSGCSGFWNAPACTGSSCSTSGGASGAFYVLNQSTGQIVADSISSSGFSNIGSYSQTGLVGEAVAPNKNFLYVSTLADGIFVYSISSSGALTLENNGQYVSPAIDAAVAVDTTSGWLIDAWLNGNGQIQLDATPLNSSGVPTGGTVPTAAFSISNAVVKQIAISSDDDIFVALGAGGTLIVPFNSSSPFPSGLNAHTIALLHSGGSDLSVAVDPSNRLFYVGEALGNAAGDGGGLRFFDYSTLAEETSSGSPLASGPSGSTGPNAILALAGYVYVANGTGSSSAGNIAWFPVSTSGSTVTLATGSSITSDVGIQPSGLAEDSTGTYLLAVAAGDGGSLGGDPDLASFTMSSGALTFFKSGNTGTDPVGAVAVAAVP
jgi:hypothetical protein